MGLIKIEMFNGGQKGCCYLRIYDRVPMLFLPIGQIKVKANKMTHPEI